MSNGHFDHVFQKDVPGGKAFRIRRQRPIDIHRAMTERPSCPACYTPGLTVGYCTRCIDTGAKERHQANREAGW